MVKEKKFAIYFLQEVHCTNETEPYWHSEWGSDSTFFQPSQALGQALLHCSTLSTTIFNFKF